MCKSYSDRKLGMSVGLYRPPVSTGSRLVRGLAHLNPLPLCGYESGVSTAYDF